MLSDYRYSFTVVWSCRSKAWYAEIIGRWSHRTDSRR